ncbi:hypothetical protein [Phenylobacterium sp.]|uniref:hypothetical protein n=1 Tax=Phenylobacterium sp. TaxID=1871053 RepID=UPI002811519B|nr:hypothetical protein [Phenylobacterium sp.]
MSPHQQHRCLVKRQGDGQPYLAFAPASGAPSSYSNSLFTLDLQAGTTHDQAETLAAQVNAVLRGVSSTVF